MIMDLLSNFDLFWNLIQKWLRETSSKLLWHTVYSTPSCKKRLIVASDPLHQFTSKSSSQDIREKQKWKIEKRPSTTGFRSQWRILCKAKITSSSCWTLQLALLKYISLVQQACKHGSFFSLVVQRLNNAPQNVQSNISITLCMDGRDKYSWSSGG